MIFNSWSYLLLLLVAVPLYYVLPTKIRILFCLLVSLLFYAMWRWDFTFLMLFSSVVDFVAARQIAATEKSPLRDRWLILSLLVNLGLLVFFKYTYFIDENIKNVVELLGGKYTSLHEKGVSIILPLGISFYTFQTISYTIDVYRRLIRPTNDFILFAAYVTFWPQLIAGPVLRAKEVIPQFLEKPRFRLDNLNFGLTKIIIGLFKKVVLADNLAMVVDSIFQMDPQYLTAFDVWVGTILFGFQIYFDFAGYSDIAIGSARLMGFQFPENFYWPYLARSPREFWQRWHISLSSWIRDYLYLPLMGERFRSTSRGGIDIETQEATGEKRGRQRAAFALFTTWFIMGLWHGAGWTFVVWGLYHAVFIYLYRRIPGLKMLSDQYPVLATFLTFLVMMAGWIPFRAVSLDQTFQLFTTILNPFKYTIFDRQLPFSYYGYTLAIMVGMAGAWGIKRFLEKHQDSLLLHSVPKYFGLAVLVFFVIIYIQTVVQFIYFQF